MASSIVEYILRLQGGQFDASIANATRGVAGLESALSSVSGVIGTTFGLAAVGAFTAQMIKAGSSVQDAQVALTTLLKNSQEAKKVIQNTMEDATKTPFAFEGLLMANKALISADATATEARESVLNLANAIAATGGGDDELQRMVVNLQQIKNTGRATAMDIRQFAYAGVNLYKALSEAGIKYSKDSELTYEQITLALKKAHDEGGIYYHGLENMAGNTSIQISNLKDKAFQLSVQMFNDLQPAITSVIDSLSKGIEYIKSSWEWMQKHGTVVKALAVGLGSAKIAMMGINTTMALMTARTIAATTATVSLSVAQMGLLGPIGLVVAAVGGIAAAFSLAIDKTNEYYANSKQQKELNKYSGIDNDSMLAGDMSSGLNNVKTYLEKKGVKGNALVQQIYDAGMLDLQLKQKTLDTRLEGAKTLEDELAIQKQIVDLNNKERILNDMRNSGFSNLMGEGGANVSGAALSKAKAVKPARAMKGERAVGSKAVTINIQINDLIKTFNVNTTNMKEGYGKIKEQVQNVLIGVLNDSQLTAGM